MNPNARTAHPRRHRGTQDEAWPQHVAPTNGEAKRSMPIASLRYRGNYSHQIRRKTAAPEATFFVFLFRLFPISPFYHKCNSSPPLENYKRGGRGHTHGDQMDTMNIETIDTHLAKTTTHAHLPQKRHGICSLYQKLVSPTMSTRHNPLHIGSFSPKPVYTLVSALHTIRA
jgi:hypothetical protein